MFDANEFLNQSTDAALDTKVIPCPVGEYMAISHVDAKSVRQWTKRDDPSVSGIALDIMWELQDESVKAACQRDKVTVKQGIMLDINEAGNIDWSKGKNIALGKVREVLGLNTPGQPFSIMMLDGRMAKVCVAHRIDGDDVFAKCEKILPLS